jgi:hypothetical protein
MPAVNILRAFLMRSARGVAFGLGIVVSDGGTKKDES